jgi:Dolichyl-phosphate-mannose-protein mannosyltransferase
LHMLFGPSVVVLRVMAVVSGIAAVGANFWLCRRVFDRRSALVSSAVLAVLPIAIAYSRFAWDASQTILATLLVLYFGLATVEREVAPPAGRPGNDKYRLRASRTPPDWLPALVAFGIAIWIHPTNVFALWLLIVPALYCYGDQCRAATRAAWQRCRGPAGTWPAGWIASLVAATLGAGLAVGWFWRGLPGGRLLGAAATRLVDPEQAGLFLRRLVQLFSGSTIFEFIPGPARTSSGLNAADVALVSLAGAAALGLVQRLRQADSGRERCLAWAVALMAGSFYLVAGPEALAPHFERYGMCLVAPGAVLLALGWSQWLGKRWIRTVESRGRKRVTWMPAAEGPRQSAQARVAAVVLAALAWLWLAVFYCDYFLVFRTHGGDSHVAFRTAAIEPKLAALETILRAEASVGQSELDGAGKQIWIVADSWWSYWPLAYFAARRHDVHVVSQEQWPAASRLVAAADALWRVEFVPVEGRWLPPAAVVAEDPPAAGKATICDYAGAPLLTVERLDAAKDRPMTAGK